MKHRAFLAAWGVIAAAACGNPAPLRIAVAFNGEGVNGAQLAAAEVNASGGIRGRPLVLRIEPDAGVAARPAVLIAERLAHDGRMLAVVGHSNSNASLAASRIYNANRIVQIAPSSSAPALGRAGPYTFRLVASDEHQARFLVDHIVAAAQHPRVAVLFVNDDYGRSLFNKVRERLEAERVELVFDATFIGSDPLPAAAATAHAIAAAAPTHVLWLGRQPQLAELMPLLRRAAPGVAVIASDGVDTPPVAANENKLYTGVRYVCFVNEHSSRPALVSLRTRYQRRTGHKLTSDAALAYDAVMLLATAARNQGPNREDIRKYLVSLGRGRPAYSGATADVAFDSTGTPPPSYCLNEVTPDGARMVNTADRIP